MRMFWHTKILSHQYTSIHSVVNCPCSWDWIHNQAKATKSSFLTFFKPNWRGFEVKVYMLTVKSFHPQHSHWPNNIYWPSHVLIVLATISSIRNVSLIIAQEVTKACPINIGTKEHQDPAMHCMCNNTITIFTWVDARYSGYLNP